MDVETGPDPQEVRLHEIIVNSLDLRPAAHLADLGCGKGISLPALLGAVPRGRVDALDIDPKMLRQVKGRHGWAIDEHRLALVTADLRKPLPYPDNTLDAALCNKVIEPFAQGPQFLHEAYRVLRPGGALVVSHWDYAGLIFAHPNQQLTRDIVNHYADNPPWLKRPTPASSTGAEESSAADLFPTDESPLLLARDLPGLLHNSPFAGSGGRVEIRIANLSSYSFERGMIGYRYAQHLAAFAARSEGFGTQVAERWLGGFDRLHHEHRFFFTAPVIVIVARRAM